MIKYDTRRDSNKMEILDFDKENEYIDKVNTMNKNKGLKYHIFTIKSILFFYFQYFLYDIFFPLSCYFLLLIYILIFNIKIVQNITKLFIF